MEKETEIVKMRLFLYVSMLSIIIILPGFGQQQISGPQSGILAPGIYIVVGDITIDFSENLTIEAGAEFRHDGYYSWTIYGQLIAQGTETDSIRFIRHSPIANNNWGGIRFQVNTSNSSILDYCVIDHCINTAPVKGGGIFIDRVSVIIKNSRISNCSAGDDGGGIYATNANITVDHCLISDNIADNFSSGGGIYLYGCNEVYISDCIFTRNIATGT